MSGNEIGLEETWTEVAKAAMTLGIHPFHGDSDIRVSLDRLTELINEQVPEGVTHEDLLRAESLVTTHVENERALYVTEHLREVGGVWQWVSVLDAASLEEAQGDRDYFTRAAEEAGDPALYRVVKITKVVQREVVQ